MWAEEEAPEKAHLEEEEREWECVQEQVCKAEEVWVWAEEEAWRQEEEWYTQEEEDHLAVERDLCEEGGPSRERAPRRWLFLLSSDSAGSLEQVLPRTRGRDERRPLRRSEGKSQGSSVTSVTRMEFLASGAR